MNDDQEFLYILVVLAWNNNASCLYYYNNITQIIQIISHPRKTCICLLNTGT